MRRFVLLALVLAAGCPAGEPEAGPEVERDAAPEEGGPPTSLPPGAMDDIILTTDRKSYASGEEVRLTLQNEAAYELGHNLCMDSRLERREEGDWVPEEVRPDEPCIALLALLAPGASASETFHLGPELPAGEYRFQVRLEHMDTGERRWHVSNTFSVTR